MAVAGCSGEESALDGDTSTRGRAPKAREVPPAPAETLVRVVDGDVGGAVRGAVVRLGRIAGRADDDGIVRLQVEPVERARARVSAPGYISRILRISLRSDDPETVQLWRRDLQWPLYGATPARTQAHPAIEIRPPFRVVWRRNLRALLEFPAVVWEGVAYIANFHGWLTALSMRDGRILWRNRVGRVSASSPAVDASRGQLVVTTKEPGRVLLVAMKTGKIRWRLATARSEPSPVVTRGIAYFGDEAGRVYALDLQRRKMRWVFRGAAKVTSSPAVVGRRLYFGDYAGRVFALNARSGRRLWTGSAGTRIYGTVAVAHGRVFAPSVFSGLSALSARTGRLLWRIPIGAYVYSSPAYYRGRVYFGSHNGLVYCVAARSGRILWRQPAGGRVSGAVQVVAGMIYAASIEHRITAWHWRTGRKLWSFPNGEYVPLSGNGARLLLHGRDRIWAVEPKRR
jgi:outer membrane protein assembly factor BamB